MKDQWLLAPRYPVALRADSKKINEFMAFPSKYVLPVFFLIVFVGPIILGPILYYGVGLIVHIPFHRAMDRALLISAIAALGLAWSRLSFKTLWPWNSDAWKQLLLGYVMAAVTAQAIIGFDLAFSGFTSAHLTTSAMPSAGSLSRWSRPSSFRRWRKRSFAVSSKAN